MKLALKLTFAVMLVMTILLLIHSILVVDREIELFENDMERHARIVGNALLAIVPEFLERGGKEKLGAIIKRVNQAEPFLRIRMVDIGESSPDRSKLHLNEMEWDSLQSGHEIIHKARDEENQEYLFAYFPILIEDSEYSAIEIAESLTPMRQYIQNTIARKIILFVAVVLLGSLLVLWLGAKIVGESVKNMVQLTTRVSNGNFSGTVTVKNRNDELSRLAAGLNDMVTNLKKSRERLEEETSQKMEALEQLHHAERLATVGKLASGLAHELGTPLNVVSGRAKMVSLGQLNSEEISECAEIIDEQSDKMTKIIRQLLDFARIRKPEKKPSMMNELVDKVLSLLKPMASGKGIKFNIIRPEHLPVVNIDPGQIQQVLTNLIMNAIHAMPDGGEIKIVMKEEEAKPPADLGHEIVNYLCLEIIDKGTGIPGENLSQIFTPFFSTKEVGKGTGLGLSISHGIVREHKGWISVSSEQGKGSTFAVYLPLKDD